MVDGRLSPEGSLIAYTSATTGQPEVYVDAFPTPAAQPEQVSKGGGRFPRWRGDGRELYFAAGDELMAVKVAPSGTTPFGVPTRLFTLPAARHYAVSPDGAKFLVPVSMTPSSSSLRLTLNWFSSLSAMDEPQR